MEERRLEERRMEERREMSRHDRSSSPQITDAEFDEILLRNKTVSSSAISRAVSDASTGMCDFICKSIIKGN